LPDEDTVLTLDRLDQATRWSMATQQQLTDATAHSQRVTTSAISPDSTSLAVGGVAGGVSILDTTTLIVTREFAAYPPEYVIDALYYSPDGNILYTVNLFLGVLAWDTRTWNTLRQVSPADTQLLETAISPDGSQLAIAIEERIFIYDAITGEQRATFAIPPISVIQTMAFSNDLRWLAIGGNIDSVMIFNTQTGELLVALRGHELNFADLGFSPNADLVATGLIGGTAYLWNLSNIPETEGSEIQIPRAELRQIPKLQLQTMLWSPDGTNLMLADWSGTVYMMSVPED
jgi:WD40 repeat protein